MIGPDHLALPRSRAVRFSPNGVHCAVSSGLATEVIDVRTGQAVSRLWEGMGASEFAFSLDGSALAARFGGWDTLCLARWDGGAFVEAEEWESLDDSWGLEFSPCGDYLVAGAKPGFEVFHARTGEVKFACEPDPERVQTLECTPNRKLWVSVHGGGPGSGGAEGDIATLRRWTWPFDRARCDTLPYRVPDLSRIALSPDGDLLAALFGSVDEETETLQVYSMSRKMILHAQPALVEPGSGLRWSPCGRYLAFLCQFGTAVGLWDFQSRQIVAEVVVGVMKEDSVSDWVNDVDFSPDGSMLAAAAKNGRIVKLEPSPKGKRVPR